MNRQNSENQMNFNIRSDDKNEHLNYILPKDARDFVLQITTTVRSSLGYHVILIVDVMMDGRQMVIKRQTRQI